MSLRTYPGYPSKEWDRFPPQATLTLNWLLNYRLNSKLSAHADLHGTFNYNRTHLNPLGIRFLVHEMTKNRRTWAPRGTYGWYIGPDLEHY